MENRVLCSEGFARDVVERVPKRAVTAVLSALELLEGDPSIGEPAAEGSDLLVLPAGPFDVVYGYDREVREARVMGLVVRP